MSNNNQIIEFQRVLTSIILGNTKSGCVPYISHKIFCDSINNGTIQMTELYEGCYVCAAKKNQSWIINTRSGVKSPDKYIKKQYILDSPEIPNLVNEMIRIWGITYNNCIFNLSSNSEFPPLGAS